MDEVIMAIQHLIIDKAQLSVGVGHPNDVHAQIVLLPWRVSVRTDADNAARVPRGAPVPLARRRTTAELLMFSDGGLDKLLAAAEVVHGNPVIVVGAVGHRISEQPLTREEQWSLLRVAGLPLQPLICHAVDA